MFQRYAKLIQCNEFKQGIHNGAISAGIACRTVFATSHLYNSLGNDIDCCVFNCISQLIGNLLNDSKFSTTISFDLGLNGLSLGQTDI